MLEPSAISPFDYPITCHAEVDLPSWLRQLTGKSGWHMSEEEETELCDIYFFRSGADEGQVVLYQSGYAIVDVNGSTLYDGHLTDMPGCARLQYFNADSGEPVLLN